MLVTGGAIARAEGAVSSLSVLPGGPSTSAGARLARDLPGAIDCVTRSLGFSAKARSYGRNHPGAIVAAARAATQQPIHRHADLCCSDRRADCSANPARAASRGDRKGVVWGKRV